MQFVIKMLELKQEWLSIDKDSIISNSQNKSPFKTHNIPLQYMTKNYKSASKYALKTLNSVLLKDGKIYNLLQQDVQKRTITCGCVKSNCEAKYCECFRWGQTCSDKCGCIGCKNKSVRKLPEVKVESNGCNCVKSGCRKKYCECFQRGKRCDETCNCRGCLNKD